MNNRPSRNELMHLINVASFSVDDVKLFLDTHPDNKEALEIGRASCRERVCQYV